MVRYQSKVPALPVFHILLIWDTAKYEWVASRSIIGTIINHHLTRNSEKFLCPTFQYLCILGARAGKCNVCCCQLQPTVSPGDDGQMSLVLNNLKKVDIQGCITSSQICNLRNTKEAWQRLWGVGGDGCPATCWSYSALVMVDFSLKVRCLCSEHLTRLSRHNHRTASI